MVSITRVGSSTIIKNTDNGFNAVIHSQIDYKIQGDSVTIEYNDHEITFKLKDIALASEADLSALGLADIRTELDVVFPIVTPVAETPTLQNLQSVIDEGNVSNKPLKYIDSSLAIENIANQTWTIIDSSGLIVGERYALLADEIQIHTAIVSLITNGGTQIELSGFLPILAEDEDQSLINGIVQSVKFTDKSLVSKEWVLANLPEVPDPTIPALEQVVKQSFTTAIGIEYYNKVENVTYTDTDKGTSNFSTAEDYSAYLQGGQSCEFYSSNTLIGTGILNNFTDTSMSFADEFTVLTGGHTIDEVTNIHTKIIFNDNSLTPVYKVQEMIDNIPPPPAASSNYLTGQTNEIATIVSYNPSMGAGFYMVGGFLDITGISASVVNLEVHYKDAEGVNSIFTFCSGNNAEKYNPAPIIIRVTGGFDINIKTTAVIGDEVIYNVGAFIKAL